MYANVSLFESKKTFAGQHGAVGTQGNGPREGSGR